MKARKRAVKRADPGVIREAFSDRTMTSALGVVRKFPGEDSHYEISDENGSREILVDVELMPNRERVLCRLGFGNDGVYRIPRVNQEVAVLIPSSPQSLVKDPLDDHPIIIGVLDTEAPAELEDDDTIIIKSAKVVVISDDTRIGSDGASDKVVRKSDLDTVVSDINARLTGHTHLGVPHASTTTGPGVVTLGPAIAPACSPGVKTD